jgi:hypothetical protein
MSPTAKKYLSALLVAIGAAVVIFAQKDLVPLAPAYAQAILVAVLTGVAHWLDAFGHADRQAVVVNQAVQETKVAAVAAVNDLAARLPARDMTAERVEAAVQAATKSLPIGP